MAFSLVKIGCHRIGIFQIIVDDVSIGVAGDDENGGIPIFGRFSHLLNELIAIHVDQINTGSDDLEFETFDCG
ncbi:hypothetical protein MnTg03_01101 [bacterium MnTg03]|nr:hypothetical protein MnTg03_01101 [bacterium MnTg03]